MKIGIASDHHGVRLKKIIIAYLEKKGHTVINYGTDTLESVDYPDYAFQVCKGIQEKEIDFGVVICYTGIGMSIACNKGKGIRCAKVEKEREAKMTRLHNDANVIALRSTIPSYRAKKIVNTFINTSFSKEERHQRRIDKLERYES